MDSVFMDLIFQELNRTQQLKSDIESKSASCMASTALIMSVLCSFIVHLCDRHRAATLFCLTYSVCIVCFCIGLLLLIFFIGILIPKRMDYFSANALSEFNDCDISDEKKKNHVIKQVVDCIERNKKVLGKMRFYFWLLCIGLFILTFCFIFTSILFFCICNGGL